MVNKIRAEFSIENQRNEGDEPPGSCAPEPLDTQVFRDET